MNKHNKSQLKAALFDAALQEPVAGARVAAIVECNGLFIHGRNSRKTHPFQAKWSKNPQAICLHAEVDAIKEALRYLEVDDLKKATLYVARAKADGSPGLAKPCEGCARCIAAFGIREVYWTE